MGGSANQDDCGVFRLAPWFSERPWGRRDLRPWCEATGTDAPVGEAWLTGPQSRIETGAMRGQTLVQAVKVHGETLLGRDADDEFPLLVKLLFPSEKLSVQVHPDDSQAQAMGHARGKTECWYVLEAEPGATILLGLRAGATARAVRAAIAAGTLEELMQFVPVAKGDMVFVDAGTVHAIGPGVVLLETQQTCDVTFRMYDYGRGRELHVEQALAVMRTKTAAGKVQARKMDGFTRLIEQRYFVVDRYEAAAGGSVEIAIGGAGCLVGLDGVAEVSGVALSRGHAVVISAECGQVIVRSEHGAEFLRCWVPRTEGASR